MPRLYSVGDGLTGGAYCRLAGAVRTLEAYTTQP